VHVFLFDVFTVGVFFLVDNITVDVFTIRGHFSVDVFSVDVFTDNSKQ